MNLKTNNHMSKSTRPKFRESEPQTRVVRCVWCVKQTAESLGQSRGGLKQEDPLEDSHTGQKGPDPLAPTVLSLVIDRKERDHSGMPCWVTKGSPLGHDSQLPSSQPGARSLWGRWEEGTSMAGTHWVQCTLQPHLVLLLLLVPTICQIPSSPLP